MERTFSKDTILRGTDMFLFDRAIDLLAAGVEAKSGRADESKRDFRQDN